MPHTNSKSYIPTRNRKKFENNASSSNKYKNERKKNDVVKFDELDRFQYLTGFSARKKLAKEASKKRALERSKKERLEFRRELRQNRLNKVKETLEQQTEYYGVDAFSTIDTEHITSGGKTQKIDTERKILKESGIKERPDGLIETTETTVTIEPFEIDHSVLIDQEDSKSHLKKNFDHLKTHSTRSNSFKSSSSKSASNSKKNHRKGKIAYESKATKNIERKKKQRKKIKNLSKK
ncbi:hypothetical protein BY996DRAFT_7085038 [Phakopsora pachyrhizi]|nr:hypothetical protein BY996DRAFT_7085038 [Phakopsora pachyrhizi]